MTLDEWKSVKSVTVQDSSVSESVKQKQIPPKSKDIKKSSNKTKKQNHRKPWEVIVDIVEREYSDTKLNLVTSLASQKDTDYETPWVPTTAAYISPEKFTLEESKIEAEYDEDSVWLSHNWFYSVSLQELQNSISEEMFETIKHDFRSQESEISRLQ